METTKKTRDLTLKDRLSRLDYRQACKLLGPGAEKLIQRGGQIEIDIDAQVKLTDELFQVTFPSGENGGVLASIRRAPDARDWLLWKCNACDAACEHIGAAFSLALEDKLALGLSAPRPERIPIESLSYDELINQALNEREERARTEKMRLGSAEPDALG